MGGRQAGKKEGRLPSVVIFCPSGSYEEGPAPGPHGRARLLLSVHGQRHPAEPTPHSQASPPGRGAGRGSGLAGDVKDISLPGNPEELLASNQFTRPGLLDCLPPENLELQMPGTELGAYPIKNKTQNQAQHERLKLTLVPHQITSPCCTVYSAWHGFIFPIIFRLRILDRTCRGLNPGPSPSTPHLYCTCGLNSHRLKALYSLFLCIQIFFILIFPFLAKSCYNYQIDDTVYKTIYKSKCKHSNQQIYIKILGYHFILHC